MNGNIEFEEPATRPAPTAPAEHSIGELLGEATRDLSTLVRQELELAKAELRVSAGQAGKGAGLLAGAGVAGHFALLFGSSALWWALGQAVGLGWSAVIVAALWAIAAGVLAMTGRTEMKRVRGLPATAETMRKIPNALKGQEEENR
jgi:hypothetical protein